ncbi:FAD/NAD(P)-binding domain-containing protein [Glonium stellatum]|uniref:FAD/NAD(P)-binding domain-containing protein n=1 Tax=Glonium stellatum TaxID=574774 RepID=A0A8E2FAF5_9PEZI|nr:FAD/NAD(P)-binding domain-containing protein [Glonium stellatum]
MPITENILDRKTVNKTETVSSANQYTTLPQCHSTPSELRVICAGAGAAGLLVAYKMKKLFTNYELVCYEKNPHIAGTWYENRYPGCACDVPAHAYTFSFEPNPNWSTFYTYGPGIRKYFKDFAAKHELMPHIKLNSRVLSATWIEEGGMYEVEVQSDSKSIRDRCHVLVNGTGFFNSKTVTVIGTGSSAIQIIPQIQKTAKHLVAFMRSAKATSPSSSTTQLLGAQYHFTEEEKRRFRDDPEYHLLYRQKLESSVNALFDMYIRGSETSKQTEALMRYEMLRRIGPGHEELKNKENVTTVHKELVKVVPEGVIDDSGILHKVDILICATGFNLAFAPPFEVRGVNGVTMADEFCPEPNVYLALTVPKFPNYFVINGVRGNWVAGTALPSHEVQAKYILKCAKKIQEESIRAFEHIDAWHKQSVWSAGCKSWYKNNVLGGKLWIWGGSALHYMKTMKEVKYEHYNIRYRNKNMWAYLGNERVRAEIVQDAGKLAPYMRNSDVPWTID